MLEKNPFRGGGMDIFWNYTLCKALADLSLVLKEPPCLNKLTLSLNISSRSKNTCTCGFYLR